MSTPAYVMDPNNVRDLAPDVLDENGRLKVMPASYWASTTMAERGLFGNRHGIYSFPTTELVDYLRTLIDGRRAIEIGAGNGVLAEALGIPATDNMQQLMPKYKAYYESIKQPIVPYGPNVLNADAHEAVRAFKPQVVIGCWVTHKYNPKRHFAGGNEMGVKEEYIIGRCETYVTVGNEHVHAKKSIWSMDHSIEYPDWLYSRALNGGRDFIATWSHKK